MEVRGCFAMLLFSFSWAVNEFDFLLDLFYAHFSHFDFLSSYFSPFSSILLWSETERTYTRITSAFRLRAVRSSHILPNSYIFPMCLRWTPQTHISRLWSQARPAAQLLRRWEDDQLLKHSSLSVSLVPPPPSTSTTSATALTLVFPTFQKSRENLSGAPSLSFSFCAVCRLSRPPRGLHVWTFRIRICNDMGQSREEDAAITEQRASDQGEEGPDQTRPWGKYWWTPEWETSNLQLWRRLLSHTLSKLVTSVYHLHPGSLCKQPCYLHGISPATHLPIPSTDSTERELSPWGDPRFSAAYTLNKECRLKPPPSRILWAKIFLFFLPNSNLLLYICVGSAAVAVR